MSGSQSYDVIVVGAGAIGCAVGRELADDHEVLVVDKGSVGAGASGMAAGLTAPTLFSYASPAVAEHANEFMQEFSGTEGFEYHARPRMELIYPEDEDVARDQADEMASYGFPVSFVDADEVATRHPLLEMDLFAGAIEIADAGFVDDTYVYTRALARDAENRGAEFLTGVEIVDVATAGGAVVGVETHDRTLEAPHVVIATGWRTRALLADIVDIPTRPFLLQAATVSLDHEVGSEFPLGRVPAESVYFRPQTDGQLRLGGGEYLIDDPSTFAERMGDSGSVEERMHESGRTAQEVVNNGIDEEFRERLTRVAPLFVKELSSPSAVELTAGWGDVDGATADGEPIIDAPVDAPDGLVIATGFNGLGITKSPVAAAGVRAILTGEEAPFALDQFALDRLSGSVDFSLQDTFAMGRQ
jgi:Glycine/D-amino acid oxidases (deaminating)